MQEEAIASWVEAMDERKNEMKEKQKIIDRLEPENDIIKEKLAQAEETI